MHLLLDSRLAVSVLQGAEKVLCSQLLGGEVSLLFESDLVLTSLREWFTADRCWSESIPWGFCTLFTFSPAWLVVALGSYPWE